MRKLISIYVYGLAVLPLLDIIDLASEPRFPALVRVAIGLLVAYLVIHGYRIGHYSRLRIGSFYYGFAAVGTLLIAAILGDV